MRKVEIADHCNSVFSEITTKLNLERFQQEAAIEGLERPSIPWENLGKLLCLLLRYLDRLLKDNPTNKFRAGRSCQGAIEDFNQAININPDYAVAYNNRGNALNQLGDNQEAIEDYTQAISISPDYAPAYYNRGLSYNRLGDKPAGMHDFQKAATLAQQQENTTLYLQAQEQINQ